LSLPVIILENPKYFGNVGMICRLVANFNLEPLRILGNQLEANFEMKWMAHGAKQEIEKIQYYTNFEECRRDLEFVIGTGMIHGRDRGDFISFEELSVKIQQKRYGIIFGREDLGLKKSTVELCDFMLDFGLPGNQKSMNLSHAVAFLLGKIYQPTRNFSTQKPNLHFVNTNYFFEYSKKIFGILGMNQFHKSENLAVKRFKTILEKNYLTQGDINFLYKMFRNIEEVYSRNREKS
jgi:TrmH family RNA methyltransferase